MDYKQSRIWGKNTSKINKVPFVNIDPIMFLEMSRCPVDMLTQDKKAKGQHVGRQTGLLKFKIIYGIIK